MHNDNYRRGNREKSRDTVQQNGTSGKGHYQSNEQRAKEQAYQEYLRLRENRSSRGNYVKDDTLYGAYFPAGGSDKSSADESRRKSINDTPYGNSDMRRNTKQKEQSERERYLEERAKSQQIAKPGRKNRDDEDKPTKAERKAKKNPVKTAENQASD